MTAIITKSGFVLPTSAIAPTRKNPKVLVFYGMPKVGKTTILAQLPNNLIFDFDEGTEMLASMHVRPKTLSEVSEICAAIVAAGRPYDYLSMDTVTSLELWAEELATQKYKDSTIGKTFKGQSVLELPNGGGYLHLRLAFAEITQMIAAAAKKAVIMVGHVRDKDLGKGDQGVNAKDIDLTGKIRNIVCSRADAVGYIYREKGMNQPLKVSFQTTDEVNCGSRCDHLKGQIFDFDWNKIFIL